MEKSIQKVINFTEIIVAILGGWLSSELKAIAPVMIILVTLMILDYVSGMVSAWKDGTLNSEKGAKGIVKKLGYLIIIACGMCFDFILTYTCDTIGIAYENRMAFGLIITIWYVVNECLSIIENVGEFSIVPAWLSNHIKKIKDKIEEDEKNNDKGD
jgi:toxin secretion/phage lysis holin